MRSGRIDCRHLAEETTDHLTVNVGQSEVAAGVAVRQLLVVHAEEVQDVACRS